METDHPFDNGPPLLYLGPPCFVAGEIAMVSEFATRIKCRTNLVAGLLFKKLEPDERDEVQLYYPDSPNCKIVQDTVVVNLLNRIVKGECLYDAEAFKGMLSADTEELVNEKPQGPRLEFLNRMLLDDAFPFELSRQQFTRRLHFILKRLGKENTFIGHFQIEIGETTRRRIWNGMASQRHYRIGQEIGTVIDRDIDSLKNAGSAKIVLLNSIKAAYRDKASFIQRCELQNRLQIVYRRFIDCGVGSVRMQVFPADPPTQTSPSFRKGKKRVANTATALEAKTCSIAEMRNGKEQTTKAQIRLPQSSFLAPASVFFESSYLKECRKAFDELPLDRPRIVILHGPSGSGKTQLAARMQRDMASRWTTHLLCSSEDWKKDLVRLRVELGLAHDSNPDPEAIFRYVANAVGDSGRWLLLLDDLRDEEMAVVLRLLPSAGNADVIITSNHRDWQLGKPIEVRGLLDDEGLACMSSQMGRALSSDERHVCKRFVTAFGGLIFPLVVLARLAAKGHSLLMLEKKIGTNLKNLGEVSKRPVDRLFERVIETIAEKDGTLDLLILLCLLHHEAIPVDQLANSPGGAKADIINAILGSDQLLARLQLLRDFSLVDFIMSKESDALVSVHQLLQAQVCRLHTKRLKELQWPLVRVLAVAFSFSWEQQDTYARILPLRPHIRHLLQHVDYASCPRGACKDAFLYLLIRLAFVDTNEMDFDSAKRLCNLWEQLVKSGRSKRKEYLCYLEVKRNLALARNEYNEALNVQLEALKHYKDVGAQMLIRESVGGIHLRRGAPTEAARHLESTMRELAGLSDIDSVSEDALVIFVTKTPPTELVSSWRAIGSVLLTLGKCYQLLKEDGRALKAVSWACYCFDQDQRLVGNVGRGLAYYLRWTLLKAGGGMEEEVERARLISQNILKNPVPLFRSIADIRQIRGELGII